MDCQGKLQFKTMYSFDDHNSLREKKIALLELLFEDGDFGFYSGGLQIFTRRVHATMQLSAIPKELQSV